MTGASPNRARGRIIARIHRDYRRDAEADGVNPSDRAAMHAWKEARAAAFYTRLRAGTPPVAHSSTPEQRAPR